MTLYRLFLILAMPVLVTAAVLRALRGREDRAALAARLGRAPLPRDRRPTIWLHAASNGELASVRPLLDRLRAARPDLRLLVTANSVSGRDLALGWGIDAQCAPFDLRSAARRLIRGWDVRAHWIVESELWPNRLAACAEAGVPVAVLGARLSARS
ncbi:MAG: 3-deoxy-D-manno-octulosonic acid transferase, partial [Paracoccaceae bacterium]